MKNNRLTNGSVIGAAKVIVDIVPKGHCIPNTKITPTSITIHNTGNNNASAKNNHNYMKNINKSGERKCSDFDWEKYIYRNRDMSIYIC